MILDETLPLQKGGGLTCTSFYTSLWWPNFILIFCSLKKSGEGQTKLVLCDWIREPTTRKQQYPAPPWVCLKIWDPPKPEQDHIGFLEPLNLESYQEVMPVELNLRVGGAECPCAVEAAAGNLGVVEVWLFGIKSNAKQLTAPQKGENFPWCLVHEWIDLWHFHTRSRPSCSLKNSER